MSLKIIRSKNIYVYIREDNKTFFFFLRKKIKNLRKDERQ